MGLHQIAHRELMALFLLAQRQEVFIDVRRERGQHFPGPEVLPLPLQRSPLWSTIEFLHLEAGCSLEALEGLQTVLSESEERWGRQFYMVLSTSPSFRYTDDKHVLTLRGQDDSQYAGLERFKRVAAELGGLVARTNSFFDALPRPIEELLGRGDPKKKDWRKEGKRIQFLAQVMALRQSLRALSMAVSISPYTQHGQLLGAGRVDSWLGVLHGAASIAGQLKVFAESYFCLDDLAVSESDQRALYGGVLNQISKLWEELSSLSQRLEATPLKIRDPFVALALETAEHGVVLRRDDLCSTLFVDIPRRATPSSSFFESWPVVCFEAGTDVYALRFLPRALEAQDVAGAVALFKQQGIPAASVSLGEESAGPVLLLRDPEQAPAATEQEGWRFGRFLSRLQSDLLPLLEGTLKNGRGLLTNKETTPDYAARTEILAQMAKLHKRLEDLALLMGAYPPVGGEELSALNRVASWRKEIRAILAEAATIQAWLEEYFNPTRLQRDGLVLEGQEQKAAGIEGMGLLCEALLALSDYVNGMKLEHGRKVSFEELRQKFERVIPTGMGFAFELQSDLSGGEGVYLSPFCFAAVLESLTANFQEHGDLAKGVRVVLSKQEKQIRIEMRNWRKFEASLLEEVPSSGEGEGLQRLFSREPGVSSAQSGTCGWIIGSVIDFMGGTVRAFNEGEEGVVEFTLAHSV